MRMVATRLASCALALVFGTLGVMRAQAGSPGEASPTGIPPDTSPILIRAERVIVRPGKVLEKVSVLIEDGVIRAIGAELEAPEGARTIEGDTLCAGFIDSWSALGLSSSALGGARTSGSARTSDGLDVHGDEHLRDEAVAAGVLAARVQAGPDQAIGGYGAVTRLADGQNHDQAVLLDDAGLAAVLGLSRESSGGFVFNPDGTVTFETGTQAMDPFDRLSGIERLVSNLESGRSYAEDQTEYRYDLEEWQAAIAKSEKKLAKDFKKAKKSRDKDVKSAEEKGKEFKEKKYKEDKKPREPKFDADKEAFGRVVNGELPLIVEVHRAGEIRYLLDITESYPRLRLILAGASGASEIAEQLAERDVAVICWPALRGNDLADEHKGPGMALAAELDKAGVQVLFGSGGRDSTATRDLPLLVQMSLAHGLDREEAFAALTTDAARAFDVADKIGSIEVGKQAELILLTGEPLHTATRVTHAVSNGQLIAQPEN